MERFDRKLHSPPADVQPASLGRKFAEAEEVKRMFPKTTVVLQVSGEGALEVLRGNAVKPVKSLTELHMKPVDIPPGGIRIVKTEPIS